MALPPPKMLGRRGTELLEAAACGQEAQVRQLLAAGADFTWRQPHTGPGPGGVVRGGRGVAAVPPRLDRPALGGPLGQRGGRPRAAAARGGSQGARLKKKEWGRRKLRKREILARHRRSPAQATSNTGRGAQRERGMRDVGNGEGEWELEGR